MNERRAISHLLLCVLFLSALLAYSGSGCAEKRLLRPDSITAMTDGYKTPVVAVVPKCTTMAFWHGVRTGAESAGKELGVDVVWSGPASEQDVEEQKHILDKFIEDKVNAVVFSACDPEALVETARKAKAEGIVVVTIDSGINDDTIPVSSVATDNVDAGRQAGHKLAQLIGNKGLVGIISIIRGVSSSDDRERGFREAISCYPDIKQGTVMYSESSVERGRAAAEDMLSRNPDLKGIFAANEYGGVGAAEAIRKRKCAGRIKIVAFDSSEPEVNALKDGIIQALIVQDPICIGFEGVKQAVNAMNGKPVNKYVTTGVKIITTEEINQPLP